MFSQDGVVLGESSRWKFIDEEENHTLVIYEVQPEDAGQYACVAINSVGKSTCTARLDVESECLSLSAVSLGERICCCCCCFSFLMRELVFWKGLVLSEFFLGGVLSLKHFNSHCVKTMSPELEVGLERPRSFMDTFFLLTGCTCTPVFPDSLCSLRGGAAPKQPEPDSETQDAGGFSADCTCSAFSP